MGYEEDLRREMFPIVSNLISTVTSICDQNGIPSASCQLWESEKARVDKRIFVKVTTAIRKDMERISRLFQKLEKTKIQSGFQITFVSSNLPKLFENRS